MRSRKTVNVYAAERAPLTENPSESESPNRSEIFDNRIVWTVDDVSNALNCSARHVRKMISEDRIPYCKVGRLVRFSPHRISEWLQKGGTR